MPEDRVKRQTHAHQLAGNQAFSKGKKSWGRPWKHSRNQTQMALTGANGGRTGREITPFRQHKTANSQEFLTWHYRGPHGNRNAYSRSKARHMEHRQALASLRMPVA